MTGTTLRRARMCCALMGVLVAVAGVLASAQPAAAHHVRAHDDALRSTLPDGSVAVFAPPPAANSLGAASASPGSASARSASESSVGASSIAAAAAGNLVYRGGPVLRTNTVYLIYWVPTGASVSAGYASTVTGYFNNVAAASGATSNVYATTQQYYDTTGNIANQTTVGGSTVATDAFPANGCTDTNSPRRPTCLSDAQLRAEIRTVMAAQGWTAGPNKMFFLFTPKDVASCWSSSFCAYTTFCAYHSASGSGSSVLIYANQPYTGPDVAGSEACGSGQNPSGNVDAAADNTINVASHEHLEAITDPQPRSGWTDSAGDENGDKCAWNFGTRLGGVYGSYYNQVIGTGRYYLQQEWSNATSSCMLLMPVGTTTRFTVTAAASSIAGAAVSITVVARDAGGNKDSGFRATVAFASSDPLATLPASYTFTAADLGAHTFTTPVLRTAGSQTITATAGSITGAATVTVGTGAISRFSVSGPTTLVAGASGSYTVTALNAAGSQLAGYRGTVRFSSTDSAATLPANTAFTSDDAGAHVFTVTPRTTGARVITVSDTVTTAAVGRATTTVTVGSLDHFTVTAAASSLAGAAVPMTVSARDANNNVVTSFRGVVTLTSSDSAATLPTAYTFTSVDNGTHAFTTPVLRTPGSKTLTATAGSTTGSATVTVTAGAVTHFSVAGPATLASGSEGTYVVTALNAANYRVAGYTGTPHFTSSDTAAVLPADTAFTGGDAGVHSFAVTLKTSGARTVVVRDTVLTAATGTATTTVTATAATQFTVTAAATTLAGAALRTTVVARDANNNVATGFRGAVTLTSSDSAATLPTAYTFTSVDNGTHAFTTPVLRTAGSRTITATSGSTSATSAGTTVLADTATRLVVTLATTVTSGQAVTVTVTARDAANNIATGYRGTVQLLSSDATASLGVRAAFTVGNAGVRTFSATLRIAGSKTVTARSTTSPVLSASATTMVEGSSW